MGYEKLIDKEDKGIECTECIKGIKYTECIECIIIFNRDYLKKNGAKMAYLCKIDKSAKKIVDDYISLLEGGKVIRIEELIENRKEVEKLIKSIETIH